jgi:S-adenosyl-L-methionine hydrolase (adenosine-forming)
VPAAPRRFDTVSFLSDFGLVDEFVGVVHGVIRRLAPETSVIDLTHEVPAHDVRAGALTLWRSVRWLTSGVVLAVVDPGVGTPRRAVAVEAAGGSLVLVGPDNGLLTPAAYALGPVRRAVALTDTRWHLRPERTGHDGATFDGRDVFAPVAAHLCAGVNLAELGEPVPIADLAGGPLVLADGEPAEVARSGLDVEALWVDRYGNVELGVRPATLDPLGPRIRLTATAETTAEAATGGGWVAVRARGYAELGAGRLGLIPDSADLVALCLDRSSAASALGLAAGDTLHLAPG